MSLSAYDVSIPVMSRGIGILQDYVDHAVRLGETAEGGVDGVLEARLAPDMLNFADQIRVACTKAERHGAKLAGIHPPAPAQAPTTAPALKARAAQAILFLESLPEESVRGAEARTFELSDPLVRGWFGGDDYLLELVLPDFFFHVATAHAILRHLGAPIGKRDYLGRLGIQSGGYS